MIKLLRYKGGNMKEILDRYKKWKELELNEGNRAELLAMENNREELHLSFDKELVFGTSGIRGISGIGTSKINGRVIARATLGFAKYILRKNIEGQNKKVLIAYDTRKDSKALAFITANVLEMNGIRACVFENVTPVSVLSYGIIRDGYDYGVMITASHNHKKYNGYKVYNGKGYQIVGDEPKEILSEIDKIDIFSKDLNQYMDVDKEYNFLDREIEDEYIDVVYRELNEKYPTKNFAKVVYSPLNGSGLYPVKELLKRLGADLTLVDEQIGIEGEFPTCPNPNPELSEVYDIGLEKLAKEDGELLIVTDPDCDRIGIATSDRILSGNEIALLLSKFIVENRDDVEILYRSIVSTSQVDIICKKHDIEVEKTLIGFKYMGERIHESNCKLALAFEEGNGYLTTDLIRDKDGISTAGMIYKLLVHYKEKEKSIEDILREIELEHGVYYSKNLNYDFEDSFGKSKIEHIMSSIRDGQKEFLNYLDMNYGYDYLSKKSLLSSECEIENKEDMKLFFDSVKTLPKSNILQFGDSKRKVILRPSGTEPKLKIYVMCKFDSEDKAKQEWDYLRESLESYVEESLNLWKEKNNE